MVEAEVVAAAEVADDELSLCIILSPSHQHSIMKRIVTLISFAVITLTALAQDAYDAANFAATDLNGTARYVGMGGALGALGGDLTVMGTNPAGTAIYRKGEVAISGSAFITGEGGQLGHDGARASLDQVGIIFVMPETQSGNSHLRMNFGINYHKSRNHFSNLATGIDHLDGVLSQTNQIADLANSAYDYGSWGMLADMSAASNSHDGILSEGYDDDGNFTGYAGVGAASAKYQRHTYGATSQANANISLSVDNRYFFGVSIGVYDINYNRESYYRELGSDGYDYDFTNWYRTEGEGFDVKLGAIIRPIADSPFRVGFAIHTPTWYRLEDSNGSILYFEDSYIDTQSSSPYKYDYRTPWKFALSLGHTIGNFFAVGAEYEYTDFSTCHYESVDGYDQSYFREINEMSEQMLRGQHTLKLGFEVKPTPAFSIRAGYNYVSSPYKSDAYRIIAYDSPFTETDFTNWKGINRVTFGLGYRYKGGYFDIAYQYQAQKGDFYAFDDVDLSPTEIENNRSQIMATLGFRF